MSNETLWMLTAVFGAALLAPFTADRLARFAAVPPVVIEIGLGILIGPAVLGWVRDTDVVSALSDLGLAFLMFLAGYEIDFRRIRGGPLRAAAWGWAASLVLGIGLGFLVAGTDARLVVGLALTTTALGTLLPMLRDHGLADTTLGTRFLAIGAAGEFLPILAIAFALSGERPAHTTIVLAVFGLVAVGAAVMARQPRHPRLARMVTSTLGTSAQVGLRLCVFVVVAMFAIAAGLGLDPVLGAFAAGIVVHLFLDAGDPHESEQVLSRLEGIGFGFFIPIFFVMSGVRFDVDALLAEPSTLLLLPVFLLFFLLVRGGPTVLLQRDALGVRPAVSLGLLASTALPLVVVITGIAQDEGVLGAGTASALVGSGMLSVLIFPTLALRLQAGAGTAASRSPRTDSASRSDSSSR
ncbi:cation:proton antiporter [Jiangella sp. DSM 45060]|uniref:cation:proton antiporter n=1 Tax=Jiangella sp. DSM 45060 TaxID=1798224 RepID=UPI000879996D|nr:cation:proton antiporter [Jiangella sp. DSM 45060]SDT10461.1 Kef-type K+ transport system, membrane component KefB [Jiangella sp. DSM 45060]